ncbi:MAG: hypothetical protein ABR987_02690 [Terracidiphilus sp.]|jgi:hypothetical protein
MNRLIPLQVKTKAFPAVTNTLCNHGSRPAAILCALALMGLACSASAQITINSKTGVVTNESNGKAVNTVDRRYQQITPTKVPLTKSELDPKTRLELIRLMQAEQGFAMRPFPRGHKGLMLEANGKLEPAGEQYLNMATAQGISAKPGDRVVITDVRIERARIVFDFNGGPDPKHRFLRHIQIGTGPTMNPVVPDDGQEPVGSRLTLTFPSHVPELTGIDVKALLAPLVSFDVKTPVQAFTDTLPAKLKDAILSHHVLVGMNIDMVLFAKGAPDNKSREMDGQMPFEEWIYGKPPNEVDFVRINGNRVIRVEVAKMGVDPVIFTKDEVEGLMRTDGTPLEASTERVAKAGDVERDPNKEAPATPPTLRNPGETLPSDDPKNRESGAMRPVQFPKPKADPQPGANPDGEPDAAAPSIPPAQPASSGQPAGGAQPAAPAPQPPAVNQLVGSLG